MSISYNDAIFHLKKLQKRLFYSESNSQSIYTCFNDKSKKFLDVEALQKFNNEICQKLLNGEQVTIKQKDNPHEYENIYALIKSIFASNEAIKKEQSRDSLFLAYPYIIGTSNKHSNLVQSIFRAPFLLWKLNIKFDTQTALTIALEKNQDDRCVPQINFSLLSVMSCIHKVNIDLYDFEPSIKNNEEILKILNFYEKCGLVFTNEEKENVINNILSHPLLANFSDCHVPRISIKSFDKSCDLIKPYGVFGIFEHGNIDTYNLYTKILNSSEAMNKYLDIANIYSTNNDNNSNYTYRENEIAQISPLDCSQKQAISSALRKDVVIQGPPGTGKSQVIANLIANAIAMKKTVLFITEKHVASNVVYNRLAEFKCACLKIFDVTNLARKNDFYQQCQNSAIVSPPERIKYVQNNFNINPSNQIEKIFIEKNNYDKFTKDDPTQKFLTFAINNAPSYQNIVDWSIDLSEFRNDSKGHFNSRVKRWTSIYTYYLKYYDIIEKYYLDKEDCKIIINRLNNYSKCKNDDDYVYLLMKNRVLEKYNPRQLKRIEKYKKSNRWSNILTLLRECDNSSIALFKSLDIKKYFTLDKKIKHNKKFNQLLTYFKKYKNNFNFDLFKKNVSFNKFKKTYAKTLSLSNKNFFESIDQLMPKKIAYDSQKVINSYADYVHEASIRAGQDLNKLRHTLLSKRRIAISELWKKYRHIILSILPVLITSPTDAACLLRDEDFSKFDYVIFDEASQITLQNGLPFVFYGKKCIISGDKKQLQPSAFFKSGLSDMHDESYTENGEKIDGLDYINESGSLLEYFDQKFDNHLLTYHYRSLKSELIEFSNIVFYDGKLVCANQLTSDNQVGIEVIETNGHWNGKQNRVEAEKIIECVKEICKQKSHGSIGIITFNSTQKDYIENELKQCNDNNVSEEFNRTRDNGEDESIFIKNIENVQGDERDIIIFSITYGISEKDGNWRQNFGPINQEGGENRINVAITRAKEKIFIFKSFPAQKITNVDKSNGVKVFHDYLEYCETFSKYKTIDCENIKAIFNKYSKQNTSNVINKNCKFESAFEEEVYNQLAKKIDGERYDIITQFKDGSYRIDLVIYDKINKKHILAIECDGHTYHHLFLAQEKRDYYRQKYLEDRGWKFYRIDSLNWFKIKDTNLIIDDIISKIEN